MGFLQFAGTYGIFRWQPADFDRKVLNGDNKKTFAEWAEMGVMKTDGTPIYDVRQFQRRGRFGVFQEFQM